MYIFGFGGKIEIHCTVRSIVRSTHAVGTTLAAPMAAPVNLAGLRDQLQKGRVFDSREAFVKAVQLVRLFLLTKFLRPFSRTNIMESSPRPTSQILLLAILVGHNLRLFWFQGAIIS